MIVVRRKFVPPQVTLIFGGERCPKGLRKSLPALPKAKCDTPLARRKPIMKYHASYRLRGNRYPGRKAGS